MSKAAPTNITLSAIAGIYILAQVIIVPALPDLGIIFLSDYRTIQLSVSAFSIGAAIVNLIAGPLSDRFGRRPIAIGFFIIFILSSLGSYFSENIYIFLLFRFFQASSAAGMVLARVIVGDIYSGSKATVMFGYISTIMAIGPLIGPLLGGLISDYLGSMQIFNFLTILGLLLFGLILYDLDETNLNRSPNMLSQIKSYPLLLLSMNFWPPTLVSAFSFSIFGIFFVGAPFVAVNVYGLSPSQIGLLLAFIPLGFVPGNIIVGKIVDRFSTKLLLILGSMLLISGPLIALLTSNLYTHPLAFFLPMLIMGFGTGIIWPVANTAIIQAVPSLAGSASGISSALMVITSALSSGFLGWNIENIDPIMGLVGTLIMAGIATILSALFIKSERQHN
ncbi:MAG: MFS transporter [Paracoccaceae bacterium]|jgi:DHA1 family bicyclomycin/chloramphenicol resistance-like MFS transporter|tara:strand:+ start:346 stop:1521 length:1176 start_codon:yes stop_codon:yes gene_type:complete